RGAHIVADAKESADELARNAAEEARNAEVARLAAAFLTLRNDDERRAERDLDRAVELAGLLAERLVGEALRIDPTRIAELATAALEETRGARHIRIEACDEDIAALSEILASVNHVAEIHANPSLRRGSLVVHTDLGRVDARLEVQLARLS